MCKRIATIPIFDQEVSGIICLDCFFKRQGTSREKILSHLEEKRKFKPITIDFTVQIEKFMDNQNFAIDENYLYSLTREEREELNNCTINPRLCRRLYDTYLCMEDYLSAIHIAKIATKLNPYNFNILLDLAFAYRLDKNYNKAISLYLEILEIEPQNEEALSHLGEVYFEKGDYFSSQRILEKLVELVPNSWRSWDYLARIYQHFGLQERYQKTKILLDSHRLPSPEMYKGYIEKKWIDKNNTPRILINTHFGTTEYPIRDYKKKDALTIYNSLEIQELVEVFEGGRIYSLGKISRNSWDSEQYFFENTFNQK